MFFTGVANAVEYIKAGKLRPLAITTTTRLEVLPEIPTVSDFVQGYEASNWYGIGAPKDTRAETIDRLNKEINAALIDPKMKARLAELGTAVLGGSAAEFRKLIADEKWGNVVKFSGAKPD